MRDDRHGQPAGHLPGRERTWAGRRVGLRAPWPRTPRSNPDLPPGGGGPPRNRVRASSQAISGSGSVGASGTRSGEFLAGSSRRHTSGATVCHVRGVWSCLNQRVPTHTRMLATSTRMGDSGGCHDDGVGTGQTPGALLVVTRPQAWLDRWGSSFDPIETNARVRMGTAGVLPPHTRSGQSRVLGQEGMAGRETVRVAQGEDGVTGTENGVPQALHKKRGRLTARVGSTPLVQHQGPPGVIQHVVLSGTPSGFHRHRAGREGFGGTPTQDGGECPEVLGLRNQDPPLITTQMACMRKTPGSAVATSSWE